jgi:hypothetical protein
MEPIIVLNKRKPWFGGDGAVQLEACVQNPMVCSGNQVFVAVRVKNESRRRVQGIKLTLFRKLLMLRGTGSNRPYASSGSSHVPLAHKRETGLGTSHSFMNFGALLSGSFASSGDGMVIHDDDIKIVSETVAEMAYKDKDFLFEHHDDRTSILHINVPVIAFLFVYILLLISFRLAMTDD